MISPILAFIYMLTILFVLSYFMCLKYWICRDIKEASLTSNYLVNKENVIKNLKIKSMVYNSVLCLFTGEVIEVICLGVAGFGRYDLNIVSEKSVNISNYCVIQDPNLIGLIDKSTFFVNRLLSIGDIIASMFPIIMALSFVILRRMYINCPYKKHIRKYIIYIILQFIVKTCLSSFVQTWFLAQLLYFPLCVFDVTTYMSTSHKFYLLLKGLMNESKINPYRKEFVKRTHTVKRFFYVQSFLMIIFTTILTITFLRNISASLDMIAYNPCFLS